METVAVTIATGAVEAGLLSWIFDVQPEPGKPDHSKAYWRRIGEGDDTFEFGADYETYT